MFYNVLQDTFKVDKVFLGKDVSECPDVDGTSEVSRVVSRDLRAECPGVDGTSGSSRFISSDIPADCPDINGSSDDSCIVSSEGSHPLELEEIFFDSSIKVLMGENESEFHNVDSVSCDSRVVVPVPDWITECLSPLEDRYVLKKVIDSGQYGKVCLLEVTDTGKEVAAKLVPYGVTESETIKWAALQHKNILPLFEVGRIIIFKVEYKGVKNK